MGNVNIRATIVSISAKSIHKALSPWCLFSYCKAKGLKGISVVEGSINDNINQIIQEIYAKSSCVIAFSCYIWNIEYIKKIGPLIKKLLPNVIIVLGGPEVSFESDLNDYQFSNYIIKGIGEESFYNLLIEIAKGKAPLNGIINGESVDLNICPTPYTSEYFDSFKGNQISEIYDRLIYYESSRGCPFNCSYCLSSANSDVQYLSLERVAEELALLVNSGASCIKFVDRTFNAERNRAIEIFKFIRELDTHCVFHFEAAAELFNDELFSVIESMPTGRVQFEIGIQTVNDKTLCAVNRKNYTALALENIKRLVSFNNCHIHVDLIAGLPFESLTTFSAGIDECISCRPNVLQLGFLKMLKGTSIRKNGDSFNAVYAEFAPYEIYATSSMTYNDIIKLKAIEKTIDRYYNSGGFSSTIDFAIKKIFGSAYSFFKKFSEYLGNGINFKTSLKNVYTRLYNFLLPFGDKIEIAHHIKLDCLSFDNKGASLPDEIPSNRNKHLELLYRTNLEKNVGFRIEYFEFINKHKLFIYEKKNPITNMFEVADINEK